MNRSFVAQAWVIWLISMATITLMTRNPLYLMILLFVARIVSAVCGTVVSRTKIHFWRLAAIIFAFSILFNFLMVRVGGTVLFVLPQHWWLIGGNKTVEAVLYGAINGLALITLLAIFLAFNASVPVSDLVRLTPRALKNVGIIVLLAVTYVPETISQLQRIRESQAIRGHRLRGLRDWQPLVIPLMIGALERSMVIAETMVSRGYGATANVKHPRWIRIGLLLGMSLAIIGWLITFRLGIAGWFLLVGGVFLVIFAIYASGRNVNHTQYRQRSWTRRDWLIAVFAIIPFLMVLLSIWLVDGFSLFYTPYPNLTLPPFNLAVGLSLILLAAPALLVESSYAYDFD